MVTDVICRPRPLGLWVAPWLGAQLTAIDKIILHSTAMITSNKEIWTGLTTENGLWMMVQATREIIQLLDMVEDHLLDRLRRLGHTGEDPHLALLQHQDTDDSHHPGLPRLLDMDGSLHRDHLQHPGCIDEDHHQVHPQREDMEEVLRLVLHKPPAGMDILFVSPHQEMATFNSIGQNRPHLPYQQAMEMETR